MKKEFTFIYILLSILIAVILIQSYLLYSFQQSVSEDSTNSQEPLSALMKPFSSGDPFDHVKKMQEEIHKSFGNFNAFFSDDPFFKKAFRDMSISPLSNIKESRDEYTIELEIPGTKEQKIDIQTSGNILTIMASSEKREDVNGTNYIHMERFAQRFERSFRLKDDADLDSLSTDYANGILEITVPKKR